MSGDNEMFQAIHENHRRSRLTHHVGYIVFNDQAEKIRCIMDAQARQGDVMSLVLLSVQLIVLAVATVATLI